MSLASSKASQAISLPWGAWYGNGEHTLELAETWHVDLLEPSAQAPLTAPAIQDAIANAVAGPSLGELAGGRGTACIVIDDLARPTPVGDLLPPILRILTAQGIQTADVTILIATGTHRRPTSSEIQMKLGSAYSDGLRIAVHDPAGDLVDTGIRYGNESLRINRVFIDAELRIAIGSALPHSFAGYGGGAKAVIPGLSDVAATARSHKFVQMGLVDGNDTDRNRFRLEIEGLVRRAGLHYVISVVPNRQMKAVGVYAGDLTEAHRHACAHAARSYATPLERTYDALIVNAYPKDIDLVQTTNALLCLRGLRRSPIKAGGAVVLASATTQGVGAHGLFSPGGVSYRPPRRLKSLGNDHLILYTPNVSSEQVRAHFWPEYGVVHDSAALVASLTRFVPATASVGVVPCGPLQQLTDCRRD
jgi:nickel-dependent lactate racemase